MQLECMGGHSSFIEFTIQVDELMNDMKRIYKHDHDYIPLIILLFKTL